MTHLHYFPVSVGVAAAVLRHPRRRSSILIQIGLLRRVSSALGLNPFVVLLILFASLLGSYINLPLVRLPEERVVSREVVEIMGVPFLAPVAVDWPGTVLAINVGGAVIPILLSFYLARPLSPVGAGLRRDRDRRLLRSSDGDPDSGPRHCRADHRAAAARRLRRARSVAALRRRRSPISAAASASSSARICSISAQLRSLGAPVASIGGAGTFDGVFLTGVIAVLLASLVTG